MSWTALSTPGDEGRKLLPEIVDAMAGSFVCSSKQYCNERGRLGW